MHSIRMRTARLLPVAPSMHYSGGCTWSGGVPGCCTWSWGGVHGPCGVYQVPGGIHGPGGDVPGCWGGCTWYHRGFYLVPRGCSMSWGCTWSRGRDTWSWAMATQCYSKFWTLVQIWFRLINRLFSQMFTIVICILRTHVCLIQKSVSLLHIYKSEIKVIILTNVKGHRHCHTTSYALSRL